MQGERCGRVRVRVGVGARGGSSYRPGCWQGTAARAAYVELCRGRHWGRRWGCCHEAMASQARVRGRIVTRVASDDASAEGECNGLRVGSDDAVRGGWW